jgi:hypothetical protein
MTEIPQIEQLAPGSWLIDGEKVFTKPDATEAEALAVANPPSPTPAEIADEQRAVRATAIKAECRARILAVGSETTQMNIAQAGIVFMAAVLDGTPRADALAASGLIEGDLELAQRWKAWVAAMQTECRRAILSGTDPVWPEVPEGVAGLAARF